MIVSGIFGFAIGYVTGLQIQVRQSLVSLLVWVHMVGKHVGNLGKTDMPVVAWKVGGKWHFWPRSWKLWEVHDNNNNNKEEF